MALITVARIADAAVALLARTVVLPRTVINVPGTDFAPPSGGKVTLRVPEARVSREQDTPGDLIDFDDVNETPVDVVLKHLYNAGHLTDEQQTLDLVSFGQQVLIPAANAIAGGAEDIVAAALAAPTPAEHLTGLDAEDVVDAALSAREVLSTNDNPPGDRWLAVSPSFATALLADPRLSQTGDDTRDPLGIGLRAATIGRLWGATVVESNALEPGSAFMYHSSGVAFGCRAPAPAKGADSATAYDQGIVLRAVRQFDVNRLREAFAVSTFAGASAVPDTEDEESSARIVRLDLDGGS